MVRRGESAAWRQRVQRVLAFEKRIDGPTNLSQSFPARVKRSARVTRANRVSGSNERPCRTATEAEFLLRVNCLSALINVDRHRLHGACVRACVRACERASERDPISLLVNTRVAFNYGLANLPERVCIARSLPDARLESRSRARPIKPECRGGTRYARA